MYLGNIVETAEADELFANPKHPYTQALLSSIPAQHPMLKQTKIVLKGDPPSPSNPPAGCKFHTRCPFAEAKCKEVVPLLQGPSNHLVACH
ncbi:ABC transporter ATP-binding protein, partial [Bacillus sp. SIMBA_161]